MKLVNLKINGLPVTVPEGTTILVRDLFYNTPARLKFMKKDSAETAAVAGLMQHLALSRPDVSFRFLKDGTEALHTPGDGRLDSAVYAALAGTSPGACSPSRGAGTACRRRALSPGPSRAGAPGPCRRSSSTGGSSSPSC